MSLIVLSQEERNRFAAYLEQEVGTEKDVLRKLGVLRKLEEKVRLPGEIIGMFKTKILAYSVIAMELRDTEEVRAGEDIDLNEKKDSEN